MKRPNIFLSNTDDHVMFEMTKTDLPLLKVATTKQTLRLTAKEYFKLYIYKLNQTPLKPFFEY